MSLVRYCAILLEPHHIGVTYDALATHHRSSPARTVYIIYLGKTRNVIKCAVNAQTRPS